MEALPILLFLIIFFVVTFGKGSLRGSAEKKWDDDREGYEKIIRLLPPDLARKILGYVEKASDGIRNVVPDTLPEELVKVGLAAGYAIKNGTHGKISTSKYAQVCSILDSDFSVLIDKYIPAANQVLLRNANSEGLGFGLITNSPANMALYKIMDTNERIKGNEKMIREYEGEINKHIAQMFEKVRQIVC